MFLALKLSLPLRVLLLQLLLAFLSFLKAQFHTLLGWPLAELAVQA